MSKFCLKMVPFVDVSAGFDSIPHTQLLRKLELICYDHQALKWLSDYLTGRSQYVVIEAEDGRRFGMPVGTPQGHSEVKDR